MSTTLKTWLLEHIWKILAVGGMGVALWVTRENDIEKLLIAVEKNRTYIEKVEANIDRRIEERFSANSRIRGEYVVNGIPRIEKIEARLQAVEMIGTERSERLVRIEVILEQILEALETKN